MIGPNKSHFQDKADIHMYSTKLGKASTWSNKNNKGIDSLMKLLGYRNTTRITKQAYLNELEAIIYDSKKHGFKVILTPEYS